MNITVYNNGYNLMWVLLDFKVEASPFETNITEETLSDVLYLELKITIFRFKIKFKFWGVDDAKQYVRSPYLLPVHLHSQMRLVKGNRNGQTYGLKLGTHHNINETLHCKSPADRDKNLCQLWWNQCFTFGKDKVFLNGAFWMKYM